MINQVKNQDFTGKDSPANSGLPARQVALQLLQSILRQHKAMDQQLSTNRNLAALPQPDRAFVRAILATTLRHLGEIDALWQACLERPLAAKAATAIDILRIGIAQLVFLKTPAHAAIFTSVELAAQNRQASFKGLINAILRRLQNEADTILAGLDDAAKLNTPRWLWDSWAEHYGNDVAYAIATAHLNEPGLDITVKTKPEEWAERLGATVLPSGTLRLKTGGMVTEKDGFGDGEWWIQDTAASIPAQLFGDIRDKDVLDLCAAPGGKSAQLASMGARVTAVDQSEKRLVRLQDNLARLNLKADVICADAAQFSSDRKFPYILLDAPCSATGTIRRHPDIPYLKTAQDIQRLSDLQLQILQNAAAQLETGGILVYAVCSLQPQEGPEVIDRCLRQMPDLKRLPIQPTEIPAFADSINNAGDIRTLPCDLGDLGGMDGFYVCRLKKVGSG